MHDIANYFKINLHDIACKMYICLNNNKQHIMATISQLQKQGKNARKFVLFSNEFGFDMYISDPAKYDGVITDTVDEALQFSVGFDDENMKLKAWSLSTGYKLQIVNI